MFLLKKYCCKMAGITIKKNQVLPLGGSVVHQWPHVKVFPDRVFSSVIYMSNYPKHGLWSMTDSEISLTHLLTSLLHRQILLKVKSEENGEGSQRSAEPGDQ